MVPAHTPLAAGRAREYGWMTSLDCCATIEPWDKTVVDPLSGVACGPADGYIHPAYPSNGSITAQQSRLVIKPYSRALPPASGACAGTTGS